MATITDPIIENWYKDLEKDLIFKVVAIDEDNDAIDVQYLNGEISEYDKESWYNSTLDYIEAPEDWTAPYGEIDIDDLGYSDPDTHFDPENEDMDVSDMLDKTG